MCDNAKSKPNRKYLTYSIIGLVLILMGIIATLNTKNYKNGIDFIISGWVIILFGLFYQEQYLKKYHSDLLPKQDLTTSIE